MGQRLSRAKAKIRDAGIRFRHPAAPEFSGRLAVVLQAVYAAYTIADSITDDTNPPDGSLRGEALRLAELLNELLPHEAEAWGLLALLRHTESRRPGRVVGGRFVPLSEQDTLLWSRELRELANENLQRAWALHNVGRFQWEAAISGVHSSRAESGVTDYPAIVTLYQALLQTSPSIGASVGAAGALLELGSTDEAARILRGIEPQSVREYQPYWVCSARLARAIGDDIAARKDTEIAVGLTDNPYLRAYLITALATG